MFCSFCVLRTRPCVALIWARSTALPITQKTYIDIGIYGVFSLAVSGTGKNGTRTGPGKNDEWVTHPFSGSENIPRDEFQLLCCRPQAKFWAKQCYYTRVSFCFQRPSRQRPPWTETPLDRDHLYRDPLYRDPRQRPSEKDPQRPSWTETPFSSHHSRLYASTGMHMSYFAYVCKTERQNGISCLISKLLHTLDSSLRDHLIMLQNGNF